jgi:hypothetical protein
MSISTTPVIIVAILSANPAVLLQFDDLGVIDLSVNSEYLVTVLTLAKKRQPFCFCHCLSVKATIDLTGGHWSLSAISRTHIKLATDVSATQLNKQALSFQLKVIHPNLC